MATQSLPTMAITEPPLYSIIDYAILKSIYERPTTRKGLTMSGERYGVRRTGGRGDGGERVSEAAQVAVNAYAQTRQSVTQCHVRSVTRFVRFLSFNFQVVPVPPLLLSRD